MGLIDISNHTFKKGQRIWFKGESDISLRNNVFLRITKIEDE